MMTNLISLKTRQAIKKGWVKKYSGPIVILWMAGMLIVYFAVHSPLREIIASKAGLESRGCFFCTYSLSSENVIHSLSALFLITIVLVAAWTIIGRFAVEGYEAPIAFGIISLALLVIPAALIGEISTLLGKGLLKPPTGPLLSAIPSICILIVNLKNGWKPRRIRYTVGDMSPLVRSLLMISLFALLSSAIISLLHPVSGYDALGYHGPMASFLWRDGNLDSYLNRAPSNWALAHPGTAELWVGLLLVAGGETLAKLGQIPFVLLGCAAVYAFARRLGLMRGAAQLAATTFLLIPIVIVQAGMMLNDLIGSALLMVAFALVCAPIEEWNNSRSILLGLSLGLVVTTKLALLPGVVFIGLYVLSTIVVNRRRIDRQKILPGFIFFTALFLIVVAPWWIRNILRYENPIFPVSLPFIGRGHSFASSIKADLAFVPRKAAWLIYPFIELHDDQSGFGLLFLVFSVIGYIVAFIKAHRRPLILFSILSITMLFSWWYFSERFPRFLLPCIGLAYAFVPWSFLAIPKRLRRFGYYLLIAASLFSVIVTFNQALLPFANQPVTRTEFYNQVWGVDPNVQSIPEGEGILYQTGYAPNFPEYVAYYILLGNSLDRLVIPTNRESNTQSIISMMKGNHIQYAYVAVSPDNQESVKRLFDLRYFELIDSSMVVKGDPAGPRRSLLRPATEEEIDLATWRYLFKLRQ